MGPVTPQPSQLAPVIQPTATLTLEYTGRKVTVVPVIETELEQLAAMGNSIHMTFFGISLGALITLGITIATVTIDVPRTYAAFVSLTALSALLTLYFGVRARFDHVAKENKLKALKTGLLS